MLIEDDLQIVHDLSRKINSFLLYYKDTNNIVMISCCNYLFDLLTIRFPREAGLAHTNLAALISKFRGVSLEDFFEIWLETRIGFVNTLDFECLLRNLTQMGAGIQVLQVLTRLWSNMIRNKCYGVLLKVFSNYIRKEYLKLWLSKGDDLQTYLKLAKYFMCGFANRERFEGE